MAQRRALVQRYGWSWGTAATALSLACHESPAGEVQLATWWGQRGEFVEPFETLKQSLVESSGLEVRIVQQLTTKGRHMQWVDRQLNPETSDRTLLDVVAYNNGGDVLRWTPCASSRYRPDFVRLRALDDPALGPLHLSTRWITSSFDPEVIDTLRCNGHVYALPVGIHQINTLFFNKRLFRSAGYAVDGEGPGERPLPASLDELELAAQLVREQLSGQDLGGGEAAVFALPRADNWTLSLFFIENVMLASATPEPYQAFWSGAACDASLLTGALQRVRALQPYFSSRELSEKYALQELIVGNAAMLVTGDWAAAEADPAEVGHIDFPGTGDAFVFTADVFTLPDLPTSNPDHGLAWLRAVTGLQTQREFAARKHALSTRADDPGRGRRGAWVRSLPAYLPGTQLNAPADYEEAFQSLSEKLQEWLESPDHAGADAVLAQYATSECARLSAHGERDAVEVRVDNVANRELELDAN